MSIRRTPIVAFLAWVLLVALPTASFGKVNLAQTRLIYDAAHREVSLVVENVGDSEALIQVWVSAGREHGEAEVPFLVIPSIQKLSAGVKQPIRVMYQGQGLADDKESLLWLNVLEIPNGESREGIVQFAIRQQIKLLFRPEKLPGTSDGAVKALKWFGRDGVLWVSNSSAYHVSLIDMVEGAMAGNKISDYLMVPPGQEMSVGSMAECAIGNGVFYKYLNDLGSSVYAESVMAC